MADHDEPKTRDQFAKAVISAAVNCRRAHRHHQGVVPTGHDHRRA